MTETRSIADTTRKKKNARPMKSFEADPDVHRMLSRATKHGCKLVAIVNEACRAWLTARGYSRKRDIPPARVALS